MGRSRKRSAFVRFCDPRFCRTRKVVFWVVFAAAFASLILALEAPQSTANHPAGTKAQADAWMTGSASNWGKWGKDDQLGSLNYITPAKRRQAAALVKTGIVVSLERPNCAQAA